MIGADELAKPSPLPMRQMFSLHLNMLREDPVNYRQRVYSQRELAPKLNTIFDSVNDPGQELLFGEIANMLSYAETKPGYVALTDTALGDAYSRDVKDMLYLLSMGLKSSRNRLVHGGVAIMADYGRQLKEIAKKLGKETVHLTLEDLAKLTTDGDFQADFLEKATPFPSTLDLQS